VSPESRVGKKMGGQRILKWASLSATGKKTAAARGGREAGSAEWIHVAAVCGACGAGPFHPLHARTTCPRSKHQTSWQWDRGRTRNQRDPGSPIAKMEIWKAGWYQAVTPQQAACSSMQCAKSHSQLYLPQYISMGVIWQCYHRKLDAAHLKAQSGGRIPNLPNLHSSMAFPSEGGFKVKPSAVVSPIPWYVWSKGIPCDVYASTFQHEPAWLCFTCRPPAAQQYDPTSLRKVPSAI
jgi:hypothetical protein